MAIYSNGQVGWKSGVAAAPTIITNGLILNLDAGNSASYPGTGTTWTDLSGQNNNGTLVNGVGYSSSNGGTLTFDGVNDRVSSFPTQFPNLGSKTIDVWFKSNTTTRQGLCGTRNGTNGWVFTINRTTAGRLTYFHTGFNVAEYDAGIVANTWIHAAVTHNASTSIARLYINGSPLGSVNVGSITASPFNGVIGDEDGTTPSVPFNGSISQTKMYNRVLSDAEVLQNYNVTKTRFGL